MRRTFAALLVAAIAAVGLSAPARASSHSEAPLIGLDPAADNTDFYIFRSPVVADFGLVVTIANFFPLVHPASGPNFAAFDPSVLYEIHYDNDHDVIPDVTYQFRFRTVVANPNTYITNLGPLLPPDGQNVRQFYSVRRIDDTGAATVLGTNFEVAPANGGPRSTPNYEANYAANKIANVPGGGRVFAGLRKDAFFVDLGSIFDLGGLRPINQLHVIPLTNTAGIDGLDSANVLTIALQVPIDSLAVNQTCDTVDNQMIKDCVVGGYSSASRQSVRVLNGDGTSRNAGRWVQVSRLGFPLVNEVLIPLGDKDRWNATKPADDAQFFGSPTKPGIVFPELSNVLEVIYPGLAGTVPNNPRLDIVSILTGTAQGLPAAQQVPPADLLRVNLSTPAASSAFPNGRDLIDDIVDVELQVLAGALITPNIPSGPLYGVPYTAISDGVNFDAEQPVLAAFPFMHTPISGYDQAPTNP